jgi:hypothetical protein
MPLPASRRFPGAPRTAVEDLLSERSASSSVTKSWYGSSLGEQSSQHPRAETADARCWSRTRWIMGAGCGVVTAPFFPEKCSGGGGSEARRGPPAGSIMGAGQRSLGSPVDAGGGPCRRSRGCRFLGGRFDVIPRWACPSCL